MSNRVFRKNYSKLQVRQASFDRLSDSAQQGRKRPGSMNRRKQA